MTQPTTKRDHLLADLRGTRTNIENIENVLETYDETMDLWTVIHDIEGCAGTLMASADWIRRISAEALDAALKED